MNCHTAKERLSEYIDGMLSEKEASTVKAHMETCPGCLREYESMSRIIEHMNNLESVDEPQGFLESVNARLEQRPSLDGLIRRLFLPLRIKLPLELAGVAAAAVLVFYILGVGDGRSQYEVTILIDGRPVSERSEEKALERGGKYESRGKKGEERGAPGETERGLKTRAKRGPGIEGIETSLEAIVSSLKGQVISSEYREGTSVPTGMIVEIRADSFETLLQEMERLGLTLQPPSRRPADGTKLVRVRIAFEYSAP